MMRGGNPDYIVYPGPDGKLGTADDVYQSLGAFTRTITITAVPGYTNSLNQVQIEVDYSTGRFKRKYVLTTFVSAF